MKIRFTSLDYYASSQKHVELCRSARSLSEIIQLLNGPASFHLAFEAQLVTERCTSYHPDAMKGDPSIDLSFVGDKL